MNQEQGRKHQSTRKSPLEIEPVCQKIIIQHDGKEEITQKVEQIETGKCEKSKGNQLIGSEDFCIIGVPKIRKTEKTEEEKIM